MRRRCIEPAKSETADRKDIRSDAADPAVTRFDDELRRWASRPPRTSPAEAAARLRGQLAEGSGRGRRRGSAAGRRWLAALIGRGPTRRTPSAAGRWWLAGAVAALAVVLVAWLLAPVHPPPPSDAPATADLAFEPAAVDDSVAVIPLDDVTVLYLHLGTGDSLPAPEKGVTR